MTFVPAGGVVFSKEAAPDAITYFPVSKSSSENAPSIKIFCVTAFSSASLSTPVTIPIYSPLSRIFSYPAIQSGASAIYSFLITPLSSVSSKVSMIGALS